MKIFIMTLGFAPARILGATFQQVYDTVGFAPYEITHLLLNNHYPVNQEENDRQIFEICASFGVKYFDQGENLGLSAGYNYLIERMVRGLGASPKDIIIGVDPDVNPVTTGWGIALQKVLNDDTISWATLQNQHSERELFERGFDQLQVNGINIMNAHRACVNSICGWRLESIKELGGLQEPKKYYGGIECMMFPMVKALGKKWVYLNDFKEEWSAKMSSEPLYAQYKDEYARKCTTNLSFKEWLDEKGGRPV